MSHMVLLLAGARRRAGPENASGRRFALVGLVALTLFGGSAGAQDIDRMQQVIRASVDAGEFSGSVLVARDGQVLLDQGYGLASREWEIPNSAETRFRLGSLTKQFTAVSLMLLAERGHLDIDAPVKLYLPDAPATWDQVTVRTLMNHTAGMPDFTRFEDYEALKTRPATLDSLIARFRDRPLDFAPGADFAYSNSGYVVLTAVLEQVSGESYAEFVRENIFAPLAMIDSGYDSHALIIPHRASGYAPGPGGVVNADYVDMSIPQGAGGLYSTTHDLLKWEQGLFGGRLLNAQSLALLTTPARSGYAMGLIVKEEDGHTIISHNGGIEGFNTWLGHDPDDRTTVVVLGNLNGPGPDALGGALMTLARGAPVTLANERRSITIAPEALQAYAGVYEIAPGFALTVSVADGKLMAQATGQGAFELFPEATDAFFLKVVDAQVAFTRDASGSVDGLVLHQGGQHMPARKK